MTNATGQATNVIKTALIKELDAYDASHGDLAHLLGVTSSAVSKWASPAGNGISYPMALAVGFVLSKTPNELADTGLFMKPERTKGCDYVELAKQVLHVCDVEPYRVKSHALRIDAKRRAEGFLMANGHLLAEVSQPKTVKSFEDLHKVFEPKKREEEEKIVETPKTTDYVPGPRQAVPQMPHVPDPGNADRNRVMLMLRNLEAFRKAAGLEWFVRDDGSLGAKRVTVEEF